MKQIDTGMTNEVWAIDCNNNIYRLNNEKTWENIQGKLKQVTVGESGMNFVVNRAKSLVQLIIKTAIRRQRTVVCMMQ